MMSFLKALVEQPYWVIALLLGVALVALPCVTVDKDYHWTTHPPQSLLLVVVGITLLLVSFAGFGLTLWSKRSADRIGAGLDLTRVEEGNGVLWTTVNKCEIRVVEGLLEDYAQRAATAVVLPCNEYFDDRCVRDTRSALGAYVNRVFEGQVDAFATLTRGECRRRLGPGTVQQKTDDESAESFGAGRCVLLTRPLDRSTPVALLSTTTQRAGQGLSARISYLFEGTSDLVARLADARINEVVMPVLGAGHGGIDAPLALVGLLLAIAEAARYGQGGQRLKRVTVVVYRRDAASPPEVDQAVVRQALALIGSRD